MRVPMLRIHTVAAGGGSILFYDGTRFRVGPQSAGADPGPKCYRRGGPLTVTDANVMVGKLRAATFPTIFGPGRDQPLDEAAVRSAFAELAAEIGDGRSAGGGGRRLHPHRGREHGQRHQEDLGAARLRRHRVRAQLLRLGRRPARLPDRRHARHGDGADPPAVGPALRLRHGAGADPREPRAVGGGAARATMRSPALDELRARLAQSAARRGRGARASSPATSPSRPGRTCATTAPTRRCPSCWPMPRPCATPSRPCTASASASSRRRSG